MIARLWKLWWEIKPILHAPWELFIMRLLLALLLWDTQSAWAAELWNPVEMVKAMVFKPLTWDITFANQPHPNGVAMWVDLTWLSIDWVERMLRLFMFTSLVAYVAGQSAAWTLAVPVVFSLLTGTLANSQGAIGHIAQGLHQVALGIWLASIWCEVRQWQRLGLWRGMTRGQVEAEIARQVLVAGYVVSAVSKLIESKAQWFASARYLPLHMVKNNDMKFYQTLDEGYLQLEGLSRLMLDHPLFCQIVFGIGLPLELLAFLALRNRRMALVMGITLWTFHWMVNQLMSLFFFFNMGLLIIFLISPWWWLAQIFGQGRKGVTATEGRV
jgi:hypothetical protein